MLRNRLPLDRFLDDFFATVFFVVGWLIVLVVVSYGVLITFRPLLEGVEAQLVGWFPLIFWLMVGRFLISHSFELGTQETIEDG